MPNFRYRWDGPSDTHLPDAGVIVGEGDEFESPVELTHPHAVPLSAAAKKAARTDPPATDAAAPQE